MCFEKAVDLGRWSCNARGETRCSACQRLSVEMLSYPPSRVTRDPWLRSGVTLMSVDFWALRVTRDP
eukprot:956378-Rhodomonas_salina.2